ncbi:MAG TPA: MraY family glycosyltransferase, partial [Pyrinomonadaceae bacterium]|nr:MraY family glycosyltransferase [Pyrinomonadaceae bacterium]
LVLTPTVRRLAEHFGWLDVPTDARRLHRRAVPRVGGVAIYVSVLAALASLFLIDTHISKVMYARGAELVGVLVPATLIFLFGLYDDLFGTSARLKFLAQGAAGALLFAFDIRIEALSLPLVGSVEVNAVVGFALTVGWVVAISNAFNLIDGMDGLAAGSSLFAALVMFVVSVIYGQMFVVVCSLAICGAIIGFLRYNFNPASIFMGDSGSLFLGFTLAALSVEGAQKASTVVALTIPLLAFGLPVIDTALALARRFIGGRPLFQPDREHIHHMLLARGWTQRRAAFVLYGASAMLGLASLLFVNDHGRATGVALIGLGVAVMIVISRLNYHEVEEVRDGVKRTLSERRARVANNVRVRRASRAMSEATTLHALFAAVSEMLVLGEFVYATVRLGRGGDTERNERVAGREREGMARRGVEVRNGLVCWSWERGDVEEAEIIGSGYFWSLRIPLSTDKAGWGYINLYRDLNADALLLDINYLCHLFQREMAQAVERVFLDDEPAAPYEGRLPAHAT